MLQRIDIRDAERIRNQRTGCRSPSRSHGNDALLGVPNEVPDNQQVSRELHLLDDGEFSLQPLLIISDRVLELPLLAQWPQRLQPPRKAFPCHMHKIAVNRVAGRDFELRKRRRNFLQPQAAALGNVERAGENFGRILEHAIHLVVALDEELCAFKLHSRSVMD